MRILVTGGAGFIGSHVADGYLAAGHDVTVFDDWSSGRRANLPTGAKFVEGDITSPRLVELVDWASFDVVNHHAAQASVRASLERPDEDARVNVYGTVNVLACASRAKVKRLVFASTAGALYGETELRPTPETAPVWPESPYGVSKRACEKYLLWANKAGAIKTVVLRYANVYGPRQGTNGEAGVVAIFTRALLRGEPVRIFGDGEQTRDFVHVSDVVRANAVALTAGDGGIYNVGTGIETSVNALYAKIAASLGKTVAPRHDDAIPGELRYSSVDATRLRRELGVRCEMTLDDGLRDVACAFKQL
ncbi:MAG: NAD-dependent epimerase/dehydratase family protein [Deltaproteobacteria bacterium]|nr:NAD-dependent epimerase/dehydratase family protein [Deltaproteobacteria bacterium]